jgi:uncharacterized protein
MIYLLDVNALVALGFMNHEFHPRVARWIRTIGSPQLASRSITELGFLRVLAQAPAYGLTVSQARSLLLRLKEAPTRPLSFLPDGRDVSHLPGWVRTPKQIADDHLSDLAKQNGALLATLDENIPGSYVIPK